MRALQYLVEEEQSAHWEPAVDGYVNCILPRDWPGGKEKMNGSATLPPMPKKCHQLVINGTDITTLQGAPQDVASASITRNKKLRSLIGGPQHVMTGYYCHKNSLESLQGAPEVVHSFACQGNMLQTFAHAPKTVHVDFIGTSNPITSLKGIGTDYLTFVGKLIDLTNLNIMSHALGLLLVKGQPKVMADFPGFDIIAKYLNKSSSADHMIDCQHELIEAGLDDLAQL